MVVNDVKLGYVDTQVVQGVIVCMSVLLSSTEKKLVVRVKDSRISAYRQSLQFKYTPLFSPPQGVLV